MSHHPKPLTQINRQFAFVYTQSGKRYHFLDPKPSEIRIEDIAWGLARQNRFYGQTRGNPYSTAHHCVLVSHAVPSEHALAGLLHDAAEAYLGDVSRWLKMVLPDYQRIEGKNEVVVMAKLGVQYPFSPEVKHADGVLAATEMRDLQHRKDWKKQTFRPLDERITPWPWRKAYDEFLKRYHELKRR